MTPMQPGHALNDTIRRYRAGAGGFMAWWKQSLLNWLPARWQERFGLQVWGYVARRPALYAFATRIGARLLSRMGGSSKLIARLPMAGRGWTETRDLPAPSGRTFRELYKERRAR